MKRRNFLTKAGAGVAGAAAATTLAAPAVAQKRIELVMVTTWPRDFPGLGTGAQRLAKRITDATDGRIQVQYFAAGERVGAFDSFDEVASGNAQAYHAADYYWKGKHPGWAYYSSVPFGLTYTEVNAWIRFGGGQQLWDKLAGNYGLKCLMAGNTGVQMGGWFNKEINTVDDLNGLKMRIPGLAGQVLENLGGEQVTLAGGEILQAIQTGAIDGAEFVGPTDDLILGLDQFEGDLYYYHPGWWEPGTALEVQVSLERWNGLPPEYQAAVRCAAADANMNTMATYDVLNQADLQRVKQFAQIREFSPELMAAFKVETENVLDQKASEDENFARILGPWREFRDGIAEWHGLAERSFLSQQTQI
jgi:TRAP-type mannitol/chloroaromatic compound transport system substrate-binding protein